MNIIKQIRFVHVSNYVQHQLRECSATYYSNYKWLSKLTLASTCIYRVAQKKVSHYRESSLNRIKNRQSG